MVKKASKLSSTKNIEKKATSKKDKKSNISKASVFSKSQKTKNLKFPKSRSTKKQKNNYSNTSITKYSIKDALSEDVKSNFSDDFFKKQLQEAIKVTNKSLIIY